MNQIIHIYSCCPDMDANCSKYFITFINDYSRYMYPYLLRSKDEILDDFKVFKAEVKNQCGKHIKIVRSYKCEEYYGKYTENGKLLVHLRSFFKKMGLLPYTLCLVLRIKMVRQKEEIKL